MTKNRFHVKALQHTSAVPRFQIIPPGQRIIRSIISVWPCMIVYVLRGMRGEPFYSIIAALQCIQPYSSSMLKEGKDRIIGTMVGAFWGSAILFLELLPVISLLGRMQGGTEGSGLPVLSDVLQACRCRWRRP